MGVCVYIPFKDAWEIGDVGVYPDNIEIFAEHLDGIHFVKKTTACRHNTFLNNENVNKCDDV